MGGVRPNARENGQISPLIAVQAACVDGSRRHPASVLLEGRKSAYIHASSRVIWGIPGQMGQFSSKGKQPMTTRQRIGLTAAGLVSAMIISAPGAGLAADTQAAWEGFVTITASTSACAGLGGTGVSDTHVSIYRPHILSTDTVSWLSIVHLRASLALGNLSESTIPQMQGTGSYAGHGLDSRALTYQYSGTNASYSFTITPAVIAETTPVVNIVGTINDFNNTFGCNLTFKGVYVKRID
jgi:hypothetical protein